MRKIMLSRRAALTGGAAALAAPVILTGDLAKASAPMKGAASAHFRRFKLGNFEVTTLLDMAREMDGPFPIFGQDQSAEAVAELAAANFLPETKMVNGFTPVIVNTGNELILFDTGLGGDNGTLTQQMRAAGYAPEQIDVVVLTHMHGDHIGGLMSGGAPSFPNARYVTGQTEYDFWASDERLSGPTEGGAKNFRAKVAPLAEKMSFIDDEGTVVSGVTGLNTFGHTPGHMSYHIESEGKQLLIWADVANHFVMSIQRPDWHVRYDMDKEKAAATRKRIFDMASTDRIPVTGYHMPFPALGFLEANGTSYRWTPVSYQLDL